VSHTHIVPAETNSRRGLMHDVDCADASMSQSCRVELPEDVGNR
jgi:hypothetical protein